MYDELRKRAIQNLERRRKKVRAMQIVGVILGSLAVFLFGIRYFMHPVDRPYMFIPIGFLAVLYSIIHTAVLGLPFVKEEEITEEDIEYEVVKIYRRYKGVEIDPTNEEELELKQIEYVLDQEEGYV